MIYYRFTAESSPVTKKFENRSMFSKAMGNNRASCFRLTGYKSKQNYIQRELCGNIVSGLLCQMQRFMKCHIHCMQLAITSKPTRPNMMPRPTFRLSEVPSSNASTTNHTFVTRSSTYKRLCEVFTDVHRQGEMLFCESETVCARRS